MLVKGATGLTRFNSLLHDLALTHSGLVFLRQSSSSNFKEFFPSCLNLQFVILNLRWYYNKISCFCVSERVMKGPLPPWHLSCLYIIHYIFQRFTVWTYCLVLLYELQRDSTQRDTQSRNHDDNKYTPVMSDRKLILTYLVMLKRMMKMAAFFINSLGLRDVYMHHQTSTSLVQIMACRLFNAKPSSEPILF